MKKYIEQSVLFQIYLNDVKNGVFCEYLVDVTPIDSVWVFSKILEVARCELNFEDIVLEALPGHFDNIVLILVGSFCEISSLKMFRCKLDQYFGLRLEGMTDEKE